jgi:hypothetical protein
MWPAVLGLALGCLAGLLALLGAALVFDRWGRVLVFVVVLLAVGLMVVAFVHHAMDGGGARVRTRTAAHRARGRWFSWLRR